MELEGKTVFVTGGSRGVGFAIAKAFAEQGARVAICGRDQAALDAAARQIGSDVLCIEADMADPKTPAMLAGKVGDAFGGLDVLVNNAGIQLNYSFFDRPYCDLEKDIDREFAVNLVAPIKLAAAFLPVMGGTRDGVVVNIGSGLALAPKINAAVYCASKAGLRNFSRALRYQAETGAKPIRVVDVMLPLVRTDMTKGRGTGKIEPAEVAETLIRGLKRNRQEILVGKARLLSLIMQLAPSLGYRILQGKPELQAPAKRM